MYETHIQKSTAARWDRLSPPGHYRGVLPCSRVAAVALALGLAQQGAGGSFPLPVVAALAFVAWMAEKQSVRLTTNLEMSVSVMPVLFAAVVYGPHAAMAVGAAALLSEFRAPYERWLIWTSTRVLAGGLAGLAAQMLLGLEPTFGQLLVAVAVAGVVEA